jgi:methionyl-tRNA formyltransferase
MMSKKILFFGNERLATGVTTKAPAFNRLLREKYEIAGLILAQNLQAQTRVQREIEIAEIADKYHVPILFPDKLYKTVDQLKAFHAEIGILIAYGKIVPQSIIDIFPKGIINIHPSLLPLHRGPTPLESVILQGEHNTGVSLMRLSNKMDAGPIFVQQEIALTGEETKQELADTLSNLGTELLIKTLPDILHSVIEPTPQLEGATFDKLISKNDGVIDWNKPAIAINREIRAFLNWPRSTFWLGEHKLIATKAHTIDTSNPDISLKQWPINDTCSMNIPGAIVQINTRTMGFTTNKDILMIDALIPDGKREMSIEAFLAGFKPVRVM